MLNNPKTARNVVLGLTGLLGLAFLAWLIPALININHKPVAKSPQQQEHQQGVSSPMIDEPLEEHELAQTQNSIEPVEKVVSEKDDSGLAHCSARCSTTLSMLDNDLVLDDETFHKLEAHINEIAAYLQTDESKRQHFLEIALTTTDGDKRGFLTDVFKRLPYQQKAELGEHFISSDNWRVRTDGITLIADDDVSSLEVASRLIDVFSNEENLHVKGSILGHLKQSSILKGDAGILQQLDSIMYTGEEPQVRVAALKAKMQLSEQPFHIIPDAVQALRTTEPEFQLAGLIAIDQILANENKHIENGAYIDKASIKSDIESIRDLAVYDGDKKRFDHLIREANAIYLRHFQYH